MELCGRCQKRAKEDGDYLCDRCRYGEDDGPPTWLGAEAQEFWNEYRPLLVAGGRLTETDEPAFLSLTISYGLMIEAAKKLAKEGLDAPGTGQDKKTTKKSPAFQIWRDAETSYRAQAATFGLTPLSRGKLSVPAPSGNNSDGLLDD